MVAGLSGRGKARPGRIGTGEGTARRYEAPAGTGKGGAAMRSPSVSA
jgi:hypothetical protein